MNTKPKRIQLSRKKGWRLPENTVLVSRPSKWGNPFKVHAPTDNPILDLLDGHHGVCFSKVAAVNRYRRHLKINPQLRRQARRELRGKHLACWCALGEACHAEVLLEIANG